MHKQSVFPELHIRNTGAEKKAQNKLKRIPTLGSGGSKVHSNEFVGHVKWLLQRYDIPTVAAAMGLSYHTIRSWKIGTSRLHIKAIPPQHIDLDIPQLFCVRCGREGHLSKDCKLPV